MQPEQGRTKLHGNVRCCSPEPLAGITSPQAWALATLDPEPQHQGIKFTAPGHAGSPCPLCTCSLWSWKPTP